MLKQIQKRGAVCISQKCVSVMKTIFNFVMIS